MRKRKPRIDLIGYENEHCVVIRTDAKPVHWVVQCRYCGKEHVQNAREIQSGAKSRQCEKFKPHNYRGIHKKYVSPTVSRCNITHAQYNDMLMEQGYKCAICGLHIDDEGHRLAVDHCHETNKVRGLLCKRCNMAIGLFDDSVMLLANAIRYVTANANAR